MAPERQRKELCDLPLLEVASRIRQRELSPVEATEAALARIAARHGQLNAFVTVLADEAIQAANQAEQEIAAGEYRGPLHGIPLSVKDLFATQGIRTTAASRVLADNVPDHDATVVERLREAGAVIIGKTNMLEFAYAAVHPDFGPSPNPWDVTRSASGSSSGSAVAAAAGMGYGSIGSDTGGSIRLPAAYCGIVGLKPTYGRVSRYGGIPVSWSADHFGPMTRTVADSAALLGAIAGEDPRDPSSGSMPVPNYLEGIEAGIAGKRIGIADPYFRQHVDASVRASLDAALDTLTSLGAEIVEIELPPPAQAVPALLALIMPEAAAYHLPWLRQQPEAYSSAVRERLELGAITPAVSYIQAQQARRSITAAFLQGMQQVDLLVTPTAPSAATPLEGDLTTGEDADPDVLAAIMNFTGPFDLTGFPAISVPCGFTASGLPLGLQLVAKPWQEALLFAAARAFEAETNWSQYLPSVLVD